MQRLYASTEPFYARHLSTCNFGVHGGMEGDILGPIISDIEDGNYPIRRFIFSKTSISLFH